VKPERLRAFIAAALANREARCAAQSALPAPVQTTDPLRAVEIYRDAEAAAAHKTTAHYLAWRDAVADWLAAPREGRRYRAIAPEEPGRW
jgi:autoinducer 2-degrading protein